MLFCCIIKNNLLKKSSLQVQIQSLAPTNVKFLKKTKRCNKRVSQFISKDNKIKILTGSMTVEAAIVFPVFIYVLFAFLYFIQLFTIQEIISNGISEMGRSISQNMHIYKDLKSEIEYGETEDTIKSTNQLEKGLKSLLNHTVLWQMLKAYLPEELINNSLIINGYEGLRFYNSYLNEDDNTFFVIVNYNIELPILFFNNNIFSIKQGLKLKGWTGYEEKSEIKEIDYEDIVYITETGTVYHIFRECTHLKIDIYESKIREVTNLRNDYGGKYKECEICVIDIISPQSIIYITSSGDRYHSSISCSGLKRCIISIPISQVNGKNLCKRCESKKK